jgi:membrane dipeptidase
MHIIFDAHEDLAYNILAFGRDYARSVHKTRQLEANTPIPQQNGTCLLGLPEHRQGNIAITLATLFATPVRYQFGTWDTYVYQDTEEAHKLYRDQLDLYRRLDEEQPLNFRLIRNAPELNMHLADRQNTEETRPLGLIPLMEGADAVRSPEELEEWWALGLRIIGPAWAGTRYSGGTGDPGPLTEAGQVLLERMQEFGFILDISHMDEAATLEALDRYEGNLLASHSNAKALLPETRSNRHLSDRVIRGMVEREGVIGVIPFNMFLKTGWKKADGRENISIALLIDQIDYICQIAGDSKHVGIGSDFDGGFGVESVPAEIDTIADLQKVAPLLAARGYTQEDIQAIFSENFIRHLQKSLPNS